MTFAELEALWTRAGGDVSLAPTMAAIAEAESSGNPNAANRTDNNGTQTSWGLWQLSDGTHNEPSAWNDPLTNASMAVAKYHSQGLHAWGTYTSGAYRAFLPSGDHQSVFERVYNQIDSATNSAATTIDNAIGQGANDVVNGATFGIYSSVSSLLKNVGPLAIGLALVGIGGIMLAFSWGEDLVKALTPVAKTVATVAAKVAE